MSINRPDGAFTVEFLLKEIADLKKQLADLKEVCSRLEDEKEIILKHVPDTHLRVALEELVAHSEAFTAAEYFAGR